MTGFRRGDIVTLREHERLCRVLAVSNPQDRKVPTDGFCVPAVLIGALLSEDPFGWVESCDLALVSR
jgi:hypothetical protein